MKDEARTRIIFMGSDAMALPLLDFLAGEAGGRVDLLGVLTQPDRPAGRGKRMRANAVKTWATGRGLPVWQPEKPGADEIERVRELRVGLILVMAYGHILKRALLEAPVRGTFNLHTSLLPAYRGAAPIQAAIAGGEAVTGVTLMRMVPRMDAGPIVDSEKVTIDRLETGQSLGEKLAGACVPLLRRNLPALVSGTARERTQDEAAASYTRKLTKDDGGVDFSFPARVLARRINALFPWPGAVVPVEGDRIRVGRADYADMQADGPPGRVVGADGKGLQVATGEGVLRLIDLQRPGGKLLPAAVFLRGYAIPVGTVLSSRPMTELVTGRTGGALPGQRNKE